MQQPYHPPDPNLTGDGEIARQAYNNIIRHANEEERRREQERREREGAAKSPTARASERKTAVAVLTAALTASIYWTLDAQRAIPAGQETMYAVAICLAVIAGLSVLALAVRLLDLVFQGLAWLVTKVVFPILALALLAWLGALVIGL